MSYSQIGQDLWVLNTLGYKTGGYFLDIGAGGQAESNTLILERVYGWQGLAVEPQKIHWDFLATRRCNIEHRPISKEKSVVFAYTHGDARVGWSGIKSSLRDETLPLITSEETLEATTVIDTLKANHAPHLIDYCSLDIEGAEMEVLEMFPFVQYHVKLFTIEHGNGPDKQKILDFMLERNYKVVNPELTKQDFWFYYYIL